MTNFLPIGSNPRFLTIGGDMLWTSIGAMAPSSIGQIDMKREKLAALISTNIPGCGGDISYGGGAVWASTIGVPLTRLSITAKCCSDHVQARVLNRLPMRQRDVRWWGRS